MHSKQHSHLEQTTLNAIGKPCQRTICTEQTTPPSPQKIPNDRTIQKNIKTGEDNKTQHLSTRLSTGFSFVSILVYDSNTCRSSKCSAGPSWVTWPVTAVPSAATNSTWLAPKAASVVCCSLLAAPSAAHCLAALMFSRGASHCVVSPRSTRTTRKTRSWSTWL